VGAQAIRETFYSSLKMGEQVLVELGLPPAVAGNLAQRFSEHDERMLDVQYRVHDDEAALRQSAQDARRELEQLFNADRGEGVLGEMTRRRDDKP